MLLLSSTVALALLVIHSWRTRGRAVTLSFFVAGILFGILRGNWVWFNVSMLSGYAEAPKPYLPQGGLLPEIGHASIQVAVGWVFALYLAWTIAELILKRLPRLARRVFVLSGLASLFMFAICYATETIAVRVGWWYWTLPTRTALFGNVNTPAMWAWFSVAHDFLMPFLVIVCSTLRHRRLRWLWLLLFPVHKMVHLAYRAVPCAYLVHEAMLLLVVVLMLFSRLRMERGEIHEASPSGRRLADVLPAAALAIFFAVLTMGTILCGGGAAELMTLVPLLMLCLLGWRRLPVAVVLVLSAAALPGYFVIGPRALYVLVPAGGYAFLKLFERLREPLWLKLSLPVLTVVLTAAVFFLDRADAIRAQHYMETWREADRLTFAGETEAAAEAYQRADRLRPRGLVGYYRSVANMTTLLHTLPAVEATRLLEHRLPRLVQEFEEIVRRDPEWATARKDLARLYILLGRIPLATKQYRDMLHYRPDDGDIMAMLGYLLLREEKIDEAEQICTRAVRLRTPPVEAVINLGVIRYYQGRYEEARVLWQQALRTAPEHVLTRANLARLKAPPRRRTIDTRYLARPVRPAAAVWAIHLAAYGKSRAPFEKVRLLLEAAQFDPTLARPHLNLVKHFYLPPRSDFHSQGRALWHARRSVDIARRSHNDEELAEGLLLLGRVLLAEGKSDEAVRVLREGLPKASGRIRPEFERLLAELADKTR